MKKHLKSNLNLEAFVDYRQGLSDSEKKIEAGVLLKEAERIDVDKAFIATMERMQKQRRKKKVFTLITRIAAVIAVPLFFFSIWSLLHLGDSPLKFDEMLTLQEIQSPEGVRTHLTLPDGSDMWLNSGSKISYTIPFTRETREVQLTGEAYFQVAKNELAPFLVHSKNTQVEVTGTAFNVKAYPEEPLVEVALKEGGVTFETILTDGRKLIGEMDPNDYLVFNRETGNCVKKNTNINRYISWHENVMVFNDTPIDEVARTLERWYGIRVVIADKEIENYKFTATFENEPLFRVLELFELSSPIAISYLPGKTDRQTHIAEKSIVTITKK